MTITVKNDDLKMVLNKLDAVKLELFRLRAMLLTEETVTEQEKKEIKKAKREIAKGSKVELQEFVREIGC